MSEKLSLETSATYFDDNCLLRRFSARMNLASKPVKDNKVVHMIKNVNIRSMYGRSAS